MAIPISDWLDDVPALCVSVVVGLPLAEVCARIIHDDDAEFATIDEAARWIDGDWAEPRGWFAIGEIDGAVFVWEDNGWRGSGREVAAALSTGGAFASMYWNVNALSVFTYAREGAVVAQFEALRTPDDSTWTSLTEVGATRVVADDWSAAPWASGLILQSHVLGIEATADRAWLSLPGVRFWVARL